MMSGYADELEAMLLQEVEESYRTVDYLNPGYQDLLASRTHNRVFGSLIPTNNNDGTSPAALPTTNWRKTICEWYYSVIDYFDISREVVGVATNYLDRYLSTQAVDKKAFQLASMACLSLALKAKESEQLSTPKLLTLGRELFTMDEVDSMESNISMALLGKLHPPTAYRFGTIMMNLLLPLDVDTTNVDHRRDVQDMTIYLMELSVLDYFFVIHRPSNVAIAAFLNAVEYACFNEVDGEPTPENMIECINQAFPVNAESEDVRDCRERLGYLYASTTQALRANADHKSVA